MLSVRLLNGPLSRRNRDISALNGFDIRRSVRVEVDALGEVALAVLLGFKRYVETWLT